MTFRPFVWLMMFSALVVSAGCSLDSLIGSNVQALPPLAKATVDPPAPSSIKEQKPSGMPVREERTKPVPVEAPVEQLPHQPSPATDDKVTSATDSDTAVVTIPPEIFRTLNLSAQPDREYHNTVLQQDEVWRGEILVTGWVTVPPHVTLTLEAGTTVRFVSDPSGGGLLVHGRLVASGDAAQPVVFTGKYSQPAANDWQGVVFLASDKKNLIEYCRVEGAAVGIDSSHSQLVVRELTATLSGTGIRLRDSYASVAGGGVSGCTYGVDSLDSELDLRDFNISSNNLGIRFHGGSLHLSGATLYGNRQAALATEKSRLKISGSSFTVNGVGLRAVGCEGSITYNRVLKNREDGVVLVNSKIRFNSNDVIQNIGTGIVITGGGSSIWGNTFDSNNPGDLSYSGDADLFAMANWWGSSEPDKALSRIRHVEPAGRILYLPVLVKPPQTN